MAAVDAIGPPSRRAWLKRAESDLIERVERRFVALGGAFHASDPLYQRLWHALKRVRSELARSGKTGHHGNDEDPPESLIRRPPGELHRAASRPQLVGVDGSRAAAKFAERRAITR